MFGLLELLNLSFVTRVTLGEVFYWLYSFNNMITYELREVLFPEPLTAPSICTWNCPVNWFCCRCARECCSPQRLFFIVLASGWEIPQIFDYCFFINSYHCCR